MTGEPRPSPESSGSEERAEDPKTPSPLDPETAARVAALKVEAARAVDGLLSGMHASPHRGASVVFVEHREYRPGDDPRLLDWRAFARSDRHTIKRFEQESQLGALLVLDASGSMDFRSEAGAGRTKLEYAATLLAALASVLSSQGDAVGLVRFDHQVTTEIRAKSGPSQDERILRELAAAPRPLPVGAPPGKNTALGEALERLAETATRRGLVVIASDLLVLPEEGQSDALVALDRLRARGHEVWVLQVLTPDELELPEVDAARFLGCEGEPSLEVDPVALRSAYLTELTRFLEDRTAKVIGAGGRYLLARTDVPPHEVLAQLISQRGGARKGTARWA